MYVTNCFVVCCALWIITIYAATVPVTFQPGDPRLCISETDSNLQRFEVLPGKGWDNLRNREEGRVVNFTYFLCKTTDDGRFLIPDNVDTIPIKSSRVETFAELFDHWTNFTTTTSNSINVDSGMDIGKFAISGKFSAEFQNVKRRQIEDKSITTRVQLRYNRYAAKLQPDAMLDATFKNRLLSIAAHLELNRTANAYYESQLLIRDYGTHITKSVDAGASLVQEDQIKYSFSSDYSMDRNKIKTSASFSFLSVVHVSMSYEHMTSKETIDQYIGNRTHSSIQTYGGPLFQSSNFSASDWERGVDSDLVALDTSGDPLYYVITPYSLPELPPTTVYQLMTIVKAAVDLYYKFNTYRGCTSRDSPNFSYQANVDDGSCHATMTNFTFSGVYQTCHPGNTGVGNLCQGMAQKNPLTADFSCPSGYSSVLLHQGRLSKGGIRHDCHTCWLFFKCCKDVRVNSDATYSSYWCYAHTPPKQQSGFLFGGLYTTKISNPMTQAPSCPKFFYALRLNADLYICVSDDYELGFAYSVPFAGFYSCSAGNPLALNTHEHTKRGLKQSARSLQSFLESGGSQSWPKACPPGYSNHLAAVDQDCEMNYCVQANAFSNIGLPHIRRPPFMPAPSDSYPGFAAVKIGPRGLDWSYLTNGTEKGSRGDDTDNSDSISPAALASISVFATLACVVIVTLLVVRVRHCRRQRIYRTRSLPSIESESLGHCRLNYGSSTNR